jgi:dipeptidase E
MRLYLSSFRLGSASTELRRLAGRGVRAAVVANAIDASDPDVRAAGLRREVDDLEALGFQVEELDLRTVSPSQAQTVLGAYDLVWVRGGNVFVLRAMLARSGADNALVDLLEHDAVAFGGYSAGPCILGSTLRGLDAVDDPGAVMPTCGMEPIWDGLGVLDVPVVPHVDSPGHPETGPLTALARRLEAAGAPHLTLRDGQVLVVDGTDRRLVG